MEKSSENWVLEGQKNTKAPCCGTWKNWASVWGHQCGSRPCSSGSISWILSHELRSKLLAALTAKISRHDLRHFFYKFYFFSSKSLDILDLPNNIVVSCNHIPTSTMKEAKPVTTMILLFLAGSANQVSAL